MHGSSDGSPWRKFVALQTFMELRDPHPTNLRTIGRDRVLLLYPTDVWNFVLTILFPDVFGYQIPPMDSGTDRGTAVHYLTLHRDADVSWCNGAWHGPFESSGASGPQKMPLNHFASGAPSHGL